MHAGHDIGSLWRQFWIVLALTIPVVLYSPIILHWLGFSMPAFPGSQYIPFVLGTVIFFYGGSFFLHGGWSELSDRQPGMMALISLAIITAYFYSVAVEFFISGEPLYWELATLISIMLLGHYYEMRAVGRARGALAELAKLMPDEAEKLVNGRIEIIPVSELHEGDVVLVRPGGKIPADGEIAEGESNVNEAMITGESRPIFKQPGASVIAGTVNGEGSLRVRVTKVGEHTALAGIMRLVEQAQESRSRSQVLADQTAFVLTVVAITVGAITLVFWLFSPQPTSFAFERMVAVLVIACPHALGLAIPLVIAISTTLGARSGLLVRDRLSLETARILDVVLFDKTGTLTRGEHGVAQIYTVPKLTEAEALSTAAAVESDSEHYLARAIVRKAEELALELPEVSQFQSMPGRGVSARIHGLEVVVGGPQLIEMEELAVPPQIEQPTRAAREAGQTLVYLVESGRVKAAIALADVVREEARQAVDQLKAEGIKVAMITGDSLDVAKAVAAELGIEEYYAEILPEHKAEKVRELQQQGRRVAMVGDGVNDAPALAQADVGIAIGAGTDVAIEAGGIVLVRNDPRDVARIIRLSRASYSKMVQNVAWATGYNVIAIPLAAGVLAGYGIVLPPAVAAILMSASTVIVAANAQLLRRLEL